MPEKKAAVIVAGLIWFLLLAVVATFAVLIFGKPEQSVVEIISFALMTIGAGFIIGVSFSILKARHDQ